MSVESQIGELVSGFVAELTELVRETALQRARELLGPEQGSPQQAKAKPGRKPRSALPALSRAASAGPASEPAPQAPDPAVAPDPEPAVDPWMRPLRPGVLENLEIKRPRRRGPKRRAEARPPVPREPPVRALVVDGVTIIPSDDTEAALATKPSPVEPAPAPAPEPAPVAAEPAKKWVVVRRPAREKQDGVPGEGNGELPRS